MVITEKDLGPWQSPEERWAEKIRVKEELIQWPFTRDIVNRAVRHFGSNHRPLLTYMYEDDVYDEIVVAEDYGSYYRLYDSDTRIQVPEADTWRELAVWLGEDPEEFIADQGLDEDFLDKDLSPGVIEEYASHDATPEGRAWEMFHELFYPPASHRFPIGELGLNCGNGPHVWIEPKVALTFLQIHLDHEETGIKIVFEDDWLKRPRGERR